MRNCGWTAFLLLNFISLVILWGILGPNYTPYNDAWVAALYYDYLSYDLSPLKLITNNRGLRAIPFFINSMFTDNEFLVLRLILFATNLATSILIFSIIRQFFPQKILFSFTSAMIIMYFPYDGTMFWLGAFGVNLGYLLCLTSLYLYIKSLERDSITLLILSLCTLLLSSRSYAGFALLQILVVSGYTLLKIEPKNSKKWLFKYVVYLVVWIQPFIYQIYNVFYGFGRERVIANVDFDLALKGFIQAFKTLYLAAPLDILNVLRSDHALEIIMLVALCTVPFLLVERFSSIKNLSKNESQGYKRVMRLAFIFSPLIFISGYLLYSFTDIRFGTGRQLLFARSSSVFLYIAAIYFISECLIKNKARRFYMLIVISVAIISGTLLTKIEVAKGYSLASQYQRIFLGDLVEFLPKLEAKNSLVIYFLDSEIFVNSNMSMLINRPQYPIRYLYSDPNIDVVSTNEFRLKKFNLKIFDETVIYNNKIKMKKNMICVLEYSLANGFSERDKIESIDSNCNFNRYGKQNQIKAKELTNRQLWYWTERNRLINKYDFDRPTSMIN